jgi:Subtilisin-like serine proteases
VAYAVGFGDYADAQWNVKMINAHLVWDAYITTIGDAAFGYGVAVAVLDTGIDYTRPELYGKVMYCINTVGPRLYKGMNLGKRADRNGHGTHAAGVIAASLDNVGVAGVAPRVRLVAVKVLSYSGIGFHSDIAEGIVEAVKAGVKILSMSLGSPSDSSVLRDASFWAYQQGAIQIAAAGNSGDGDSTTNNVAYPARYSWVIAVAAVDQNYNVPTWSSDGPEVDVAASGVNILSTYPGGRYAYMSGTSVATPHVTSVVALIKAVRSALGLRPLTPDEMYYVLTSTAKDIGPPGFDVFSGYGLVDVYAAVNVALEIE